MLRKISLKGIFSKLTQPPTSAAAADNLSPEKKPDFDPYADSSAPRDDSSALKKEQKKFEEVCTAKAFAPQESEGKDFKIDEFYVNNPDADKNKKKSRREMFFSDIAEGVCVAVSIFLVAGLFGESYVKDSVPACAFIAFIPFAIIILNVKNAFLNWLYGLSIGFLSYLVILYWIFPTVNEGTGDVFLSWSALLALSFVLSLQFAFFSLSAHYLKKINWLFPLSAACAWVMWEFLAGLIAYKFIGFPWFVLGYTQYANQPLIQISSVTGAYGVSFAIAFFGLSLGYIAGRKSGFLRILYIVLPVALFASLYYYGDCKIENYENLMHSSHKRIATAIMQPDTHPLMLKGYYNEVTALLNNQAAGLKGKRLDLILWPESSYPGSFKESEYQAFITELSRETGAVQITGSAYSTRAGDYVAAGLFDGHGLKDLYFKNKIVPFGEFVPFKGILGGFYKKHNVTSLTGDFKAGKNPGKVFVFPLTDEFGRVENLSFGTEICFESIFSSVFRAQAANGAQFFVNISNDGWFLDTSAPYQHLRATVFRAVENHRPLLRATNTGVSAWIDALGKIKMQTELDTRTTQIVHFDFYPRCPKTFYTLYGDIFAYICCIITLTVLIFSAAFIYKKYD